MYLVDERVLRVRTSKMRKFSFRVRIGGMRRAAKKQKEPLKAGYQVQF